MLLQLELPLVTDQVVPGISQKIGLSKVEQVINFLAYLIIFQIGAYQMCRKTF